MAEPTTQDGITEGDIESAFKVLEAMRENFQEDNMKSMSGIVNEAHYLIQQYREGANWKTHSFEVGDYALDDAEPTPSPEANTVEIVDLIDQRADEFVIEETGKTVAEHNKYYPSDDLVVAGTYPNMGDPDKVWHFPESRLRKT